MTARAAHSASGTDPGRSGAQGLARLWHRGKWVYYFGRTSVHQPRMLIARKTDGKTYDDWSTVPVDARTLDYPAAAGPNSYIAVVWRDALTGELLLTRTIDGVEYAAPRPLGARATAAPAAVYDPNTDHLLVFYRGSGGELGLVRSPDGRAFLPPIILGTPGPLVAAPLASLARRAGRDRPTVEIAVGDTLYAAESDDGGRFGPWVAVTRRGLGVACARDYPLALGVGPNLISPTRYERPERGGADPWPFTLAATAAMAPTAVKLNLFYEGNYPRPIFNEAQLDDVLGLGVETIIFRTVEYTIDPEAILHQLEAVDMNAGTGRAARTYLDYIRAHPAVEFLIEVGNEPNVGPKSAARTRADLLGTIRRYDTAPYRREFPNLRWLASLPYSKAFGGSDEPVARALDYLDEIIDSGEAPEESREIARRYDGFAAHLYGVDAPFGGRPPGAGGDRATLLQQLPQRLPSLAARPDGQISDPDAARFLDRTLRVTVLPVYITEAGTFGQLPPPGLPWAAKAEEYVRALYRLPRQVAGCIFFAVTLKDDAYGNGFAACPIRLGIDADCRGRPEPTDFAGAGRIGAR